ncbi:31413_t:CDS:1, partial [Gigaspora margarita]
ICIFAKLCDANFNTDGVRAMKKWLDHVYNFFVDYHKVVLTNIYNQEIEAAYYEM